VALERGSNGADPVRQGPFAAQQELRVGRSWHLGTGTIACPRCDAPVALGAPAMGPADALGCPYCGHVAALRDFLSLEAPARPARVTLRVVERARAITSSRGSAAPPSRSRPGR
jgi:hypothetical protein